jgi:hypothetical protein
MNFLPVFYLTDISRTIQRSPITRFRLSRLRAKSAPLASHTASNTATATTLTTTNTPTPGACPDPAVMVITPATTVTPVETAADVPTPAHLPTPESKSTSTCSHHHQSDHPSIDSRSSTAPWVGVVNRAGRLSVGSALCINYGTLGNLDLLLRFGFALSDNIADCFPLPLPLPSPISTTPTCTSTSTKSNRRGPNREQQRGVGPGFDGVGSVAWLQTDGDLPPALLNAWRLKEKVPISDASDVNFFRISLNCCVARRKTPRVVWYILGKRKNFRRFRGR